MMADYNIKKRLGEDFTFGVDYTNREPVESGATLTSGTATAVRVADSVTDTSILSSTTLTISGNKFLIRAMSNIGTIGQKYFVTFDCNFSNTDTLQPTFLIEII